jgi:HSP20 family protein
MTERDVEVTLAGGMLTVKSEKREEKEECLQGYTMAERRYGSFRRAFSLPEDADAERIEISLKDGVLIVVLPRKAEAKAQERKVEIKAAA